MKFLMFDFSDAEHKFRSVMAIVLSLSLPVVLVYISHVFKRDLCEGGNCELGGFLLPLVIFPVATIIHGIASLVVALIASAVFKNLSYLNISIIKTAFGVMGLYFALLFSLFCLFIFFVIMYALLKSVAGRTF